MPNIKLQSSDDEIYTVDIDVAKMSETIKTMMDDLGIDESKDIQDVLTLPVTSSVLRIVTEWATEHRDDPWRQMDDITDWDKTFLRVIHEKMILFPTNSRRPSSC